MDLHDNEPSYYEVALTNRQVVTGFVILLACLFAAFLSGVWLGRDGTFGGAPGPELASLAERPEAGEARLEQLTFFSEDKADREPTPPSRDTPATKAPAMTPAPEPEISPAAAAEAERLRRTLEAEMAEHRAEPSAVEAAPVAGTPVAGTRVRRAEAPAASAPAPEPAIATAGTSEAPTWIQVYSSPDGPKARELAARLRRNRFEAVVLEAASGGGTTFRVRVGPYARREDADRAASRLRREFRLDTWVTDQP